MLNAMLLASSNSNILTGAMSLITELIFGLNPAWLWTGAIAFPIGGIIIIYVGASILSLINTHSETVVISGLQRSIPFFVVCMALGLTGVFPIAIIGLTIYVCFFICLVIGILYSIIVSASSKLWLLRLKEYTVSFISKASAINSLAVQAAIASIFQLQINPVDLVCLSLARDIHCPKDPIFRWPVPCTYPRLVKNLVSLVELVSPATANSYFFGYFCDLRSSGLAAHLEDTTIQRGPHLADSAALKPIELEEHLKRFNDICGTDEKWWVSEGVLSEFLIDNQTALEKRLDLIAKATSNIWMVTWLIEHSPSAERLADALIQRAYEGIEVKVMVDAVTLCYLDQKNKIRGMNDMQTLERLARSPGVEVRMLDSINEDMEPSFIVGNHRKILLVDDTWMLTGGRNTSDSYFTNNGFHYLDADVVLQGCFEASTSILFQSLWVHSREVKLLFGPQVFEEEETLSSDESTAGFESTDKDQSELQVKNTRAVANDDANNVTIFQLEHKAGNTDGHDIIFTALLFLIESAEETIDLVMGYFQLLSPDLEAALRCAVARGVRIRLATNSAKSNGLPYFNGLFGQALDCLIDMGVEVYVTADLTKYQQYGDFCLHYKLAVFDQKVALVGSWNPIGASVFYDSDFSVILFDQRKEDKKASDGNLFQALEDIIDGAISAGSMVRLYEIEDHSFLVPLIYYLVASKFARRTIKQGY